MVPPANILPLSWQFGMRTLGVWRWPIYRGAMRTLYLLAGLSLIAAAPAGDNVAVLHGLQQMDARVAALAGRLALKNAALCPVKEPQRGFLMHHIGQYDPDMRDAARQAFRLGGRVEVLAVVPDSAAERAGLRVGDALVALNGVMLPYPAVPKSESFAAVADVEAQLEKAYATGNIDLKIVRTELQRTIRFTPEAGCPVLVEVLPGKKLNAWADGKRVQITTAVIDQTKDDDELSFVIAHEMAHNVLGHAARLKADKRSKALIRESEKEADVLAIRMMKIAGFDPLAASRFWARFGKKTGAGIFSDGTHMRTRERVVFLLNLVIEQNRQDSPKPPAQ
jgi:beta-barrel assembly-enhancing protease